MLLICCYILIQMIEVLLGVWILRSLFPEARRNSNWIYGIGIAGCLILGVCYVWNAFDSFISNMFILLFALTFSGFYCICYKVKYFEIFLLEMLYMISISFLKLPILILEGLIYGNNLISVNRGNRTILECCWCIILMTGIIFVIKKGKVLKHYKEYIYLLLSDHVGMLLFITTIQWLLLSYNMWLGKQGFQTIDFILNVILIFSIFLSLHHYILRMINHSVQIENSRLDISRDLLQKQNSVLHEMYKRNSLRLHEYYRTLEYLYYCIKEEKYRDAEFFLSKNLEELKEENQQVWTGLSFLDFIINYKKQVMDEKGIVFQLELDIYEYPFEESELGILLGNLLDNAIEACEKCESEEREIYLRMWNIKYMFMLKLINSSSKCPTLVERRFITDKADKNAHGMGVEQVKRIVRKYGGDISFQYSGKHFETKIIVSTMKEEK